MESMNAKVHHNDITGTKFGIRLSLGSAGNQIYSNTFDTATDWGLYTYQGSDPPTTGVSDGRLAYNVFENNKVTGTAGGVKFKNSDNISVIGEFGRSLAPGLLLLQGEGTRRRSHAREAMGRTICVLYRRRT